MTRGNAVEGRAGRGRGPRTTRARIDRWLLLARTARHLRWRQLVFRPVRRLQRLSTPRVPRTAEPFDAARMPALAVVVRGWETEPDEAGIRRAEEVVADRFRFLNHVEHLPSIDWRRRHVGHHWSYHLHSFDHAQDLARAFRRTGERRFLETFERLATGWIDGAPPGTGDGWEPYPLSQRVLNWSYALLLFGDALSPATRERLRTSLFAQLAFLGRRLEWHILANHLQKNVTALAVGGLLFGGERAARWRKLGSDGLWRELFEQVLPDGGHFERSPMYHALALADYLRVVSLLRGSGAAVPAEAADRIRAMIAAYAALSRPDGTLHLFNDAANGAAPSRREIRRLARAALDEPIPEPDGVVALPETGYYGCITRAAGDRLVVDGGAPGPAYQPAHAHCGILSFELDLGGRPVVVDSGLHGYAGDPYREYVRSTRAHNTVRIAGREQSEVWDTFRMARRARMLGAGQELEGGRYRFTGAYRPYHDRRAEHRRTIEWASGTVRATDRVAGAEGAPLASFLHLHPDFGVERDGTAIVATSAQITVRVEPFGCDEVRVRIGERDPVQGWYCPEFGKAVPAPVLELAVGANDGRAFGYSIRRVGAG